MKRQERKDLLVRLGQYMTGNDERWRAAIQRAFAENHWFIPEFTDLAVRNIATQYLADESLQLLIDRYHIPEEMDPPKAVGIVMAGNIPLVGFHDFLCTFLVGHVARIKPSSKDEVLIKHLVQKLIEWDPRAEAHVQVQEMIRNCDAYIATGSNNSARYFEQYFQKYPHIIRRNRTSVAVLSGGETKEELERLADDVYLYFGLGCRNVTQIYVPEGYDFLPLLNVFRKYNYLINHHKYKNNYDYNLAVHILNNQYYMSNESLLLVESASPFSPIAQLHYQFYSKPEEVFEKLNGHPDIQCIVGSGNTGFGGAQVPGICDFADGADTVRFLLSLK